MPTSIYRTLHAMHTANKCRISFRVSSPRSNWVSRNKTKAALTVYRRMKSLKLFSSHFYLTKNSQEFFERVLNYCSGRHKVYIRFKLNYCRKSIFPECRQMANDLRQIAIYGQNLERGQNEFRLLETRAPNQLDKINQMVKLTIEQDIVLFNTVICKLDNKIPAHPEQIAIKRNQCEIIWNNLRRSWKKICSTMASQPSVVLEEKMKRVTVLLEGQTYYFQYILVELTSIMVGLEQLLNGLTQRTYINMRQMIDQFSDQVKNAISGVRS